MSGKEKLRFRINDRNISYEGHPNQRPKDLCDILTKLNVELDTVVPTFRVNIPETTLTDKEILALFEESKRARQARKSTTAAAAPSAAGDLQAQGSVDFAQSVNNNNNASSSTFAPPAPAAADAPVDEKPQQITLVINGSRFSYSGLVSKKESALLELCIKQSLAPEQIVKAHRDNMTDGGAAARTEAEILKLFEEAKAAREARKSKKKDDGSSKAAPAAAPATTTTTPAAAAPSSTTTAAAAAPSAGQGQLTADMQVRHAATRSAIDEIALMSSQEKDSINSFINQVLQSNTTPGAAVAAAGHASPVPAATATPSSSNATATTTSSSAATASQAVPPVTPSNLASTTVNFESTVSAMEQSHNVAPADMGPKIAVYCQEEGTTATKIVYTGKNVSFADFMAVIERKFGRRMVLSFFDGDDKLEVDDDDVLQLFFEQNGDGKKLRLICSAPESRRVVRDDALTERPGTAAAATASASSGGARPSPPAAGAPSKSPLTIKEVRAFTGHSEAVYSCSFAPTGDRFCSAARDRSVRVWKCDNTGCSIMRGGHNGFVLSCDFSPNNINVVSSADDATIKIWNANTCQKHMSLRGHDDKVYCVQYNTTGAYIVSGSCDKTVKVWNADSGRCQATLKGHDLAVFSCCFSNTDAGRYVASGSDDRLVKVWDWREGKEVRTMMGHTGTVWSVRYSHHDKYIVSASMDHELKLWDAATAQCIHTLMGHMTPIHQAVFTQNDRYILSCARDWTVMVWDTETGQHLETIHGHRNTVYHLDVRGDQLLTSSLDGSIKLWSIEEKK